MQLSLILIIHKVQVDLGWKHEMETKTSKLTIISICGFKRGGIILGTLTIITFSQKLCECNYGHTRVPTTFGHFFRICQLWIAAANDPLRSGHLAGGTRTGSCPPRRQKPPERQPGAVFRGPGWRPAALSFCCSSWQPTWLSSATLPTPVHDPKVSRRLVFLRFAFCLRYRVSWKSCTELKPLMRKGSDLRWGTHGRNSIVTPIKVVQPLRKVGFFISSILPLVTKSSRARYKARKIT